MIQLLRKGGREEPQSTQPLSPPSTPTPPPSTPTSRAQSSFCSGSLGLSYLLLRQLQNNVVPSHHLSQNAFLPLQEALGTLFCDSTSSPERSPTVPAPSWAWPWQRLRGVPSGVQLSAPAVKGDVKPPETPQEAVGDFTSIFM